MSISLAPIVLGKLPPHDSVAYKYAKVGFMGQVPVKVSGKVNSGDYIVASGKNDGIGFAVAPEALRLEHLSRILGRAYTGSAHEGLAFINVVIGVKTNEWVEIFKDHQQKIDALEAQVDALTALKKENEQMRADLDRVMQTLGIPEQQSVGLKNK